MSAEQRKLVYRNKNGAGRDNYVGQLAVGRKVLGRKLRKGIAELKPPDESILTSLLYRCRDRVTNHRVYRRLVVEDVPPLNTLFVAKNGKLDI